jgi:insertion element IS1 protein InsB
VELDELCVSKKRNLWLWTAVSRYSGQILAFVLGARTWDNVAGLWQKVPQAYRCRLVYTDGYGAYGAFFSSWQHRLCEKFDGGTCTVEGVNHSLRHRCGALVRRTSARCRSLELLSKRLDITVAAHNRAGQRRLKRRAKATQKKR